MDSTYEQKCENDEPQKRQSFARSLIDVLLVVVIAVGLAFVLKTYVVQPFRIPSGSMESTIMTGDFVLAEKISYRLGPIEQGDIVVFENPTNISGDRHADDRYLIKRVIATGGQTVNMRDGYVYVDDVLIQEDYTQGTSEPLPTTFENRDISFPYVVPDGSLWLMGDNRQHSSDSRYFGAVDERDVVGRGFFIYWPTSSFGLLE